MEILVTGSEGVFAQKVITELLAQGHSVVGVDNLSKYNEVKNIGQYSLIQGDLTDTVFTNSLFIDKRYDMVLHFAAMIYGVLWYDKHPADVLSNNISMTSNLLANHSSIDKFVYMSSSMVYENTTIYPSKELDQVPIMSTDYGFSKYVCERLVNSYSKQHALSYLIWRPFNVFDINENLNPIAGVGHVFSDLVRKILIEQQTPIYLLGDGNQTRTFIDIRDAAYAVASFSEKLEGTYNLGTEEEITIKKLASLIAKKAIELELLSDSYNVSFSNKEVHNNDVKRRGPDISKLVYSTSWKPSISLDKSIEDFLLCLVR